MSIKLSGLSLKELKILRTKVDLAVQKLEAKNLSKARIEVANLARDYGIPLEALIDKKAASKPALKPTKKTVPPKYRHPDDATLFWSGRGLKPKWVVALLESGIKLEDLEIK